MNVMTIRPALELETKSGFHFTVRPADESDDPALTAFFEEHVTKDDLRFRFLSPAQHVNQKQIEAMTHIDHRQTEDFLAFAPDNEEIIASAVLAADKAMQTAEVAFTVHADYKGKGIESRLLEYVTTQARARGLKKLIAIESRENHCTITLEREMGFKTKAIDGEPMLVMLETTL
ncbi:MAG TPA: GNAT family N-acetyltransferase [Hyphomicrobiaceae bacterium]|nr:GNAT family N-acetyltransferase [Hyphomicrobiaceae bacterium]